MVRWATGRRVVQSVLVTALGGFALFQFGPYGEVRSLAGVLPEEAVTSRGGLHAFLAELGVGGRELYATFQLWDFLNPLIIGLSSVALTGWLLGRSRLVRGRTLAMFVPVVGPAADLLENAILLRAITAFPSDAGVATLLPVITSAKFMGLGATLVLSLALSVLAWRRRKNPSRAGAS